PFTAPSDPGAVPWPAPPPEPPPLPAPSRPVGAAPRSAEASAAGCVGPPVPVVSVKPATPVNATATAPRATVVRVARRRGASPGAAAARTLARLGAAAGAGAVRPS